jgi:hypothetical protein
MRPLKDSPETNDPDQALATRMLRATRPTVASAMARQRVRAAIAVRGAPKRSLAWKLLGVAAPIGILIVGSIVHRKDRPLAPAVPPVTAPPIAPEIVPAPTSPHVEALPHAQRRPAVQKPAPEDDRESALLVEAGERLRRAHDAEGARKLVDIYLRRFPNGVLVEEAYAIALEGAAGDERDRVTATEYLRRFPNGRFQDLANRVLGGEPR